MAKPALTLHRLELFLAVLDEGGVGRAAKARNISQPAVSRFHAAHPGIALSLRISDTRDIERWVSAGQVELGVIGEAPLVPGLAAESWVKDELVLIVPRGHPLARRPAVTAPAITGEPYIPREEGPRRRGGGG